MLPKELKNCRVMILDYFSKYLKILGYRAGDLSIFIHTLRRAYFVGQPSFKDQDLDIITWHCRLIFLKEKIIDFILKYCVTLCDELWLGQGRPRHETPEKCLFK